MVQSTVEYTFRRCSFFMQNINTTHLSEIRDRDEIFVSVGMAKTSFLDVRDIGAVAAKVLTQPGHEKKAYDLTGSEALNYYQVAELFSQILGRKITCKNPPAIHFFNRQLRLKSNFMYALITTWLYANTKSGMANQVTGEVERLLRRRPMLMREYFQDNCSVWQC